MSLTAAAGRKVADTREPSEANRVLAILYSFPPSREVGAQTGAQICRYLPAYEWDVTVLTVREASIEEHDGQIDQSFPGNVIRTTVIPHPLSLYRWLMARLRSERQEIVSASATSADSIPDGAGLRHWLLSMLMIPDIYTGWIPPAVFNGLAAIRAQRVNCLFSSGPWWTNHLVGLVLAELTGLPWIAHFRDSWAQGHFEKLVTKRSIRIEKKLERWVLKKASAVVCVTDMQTAMLRRANPDLPPSKFVTISNGYDGAEWTAVLGDRTGPATTNNDAFTITYAGSLYHGRSPYPLFRAVQSLIDRGEIDGERIRIELLGFCEMAEGLRVKDVAAMHGLTDCVATPGIMSRPETLRRMTRSDLLLLLIDEQSYSIPAKTYEYLRAGRPILALTPGGAAVDLLSQTGGAWVVNPTDDTGIKTAVMEAYRSWSSGVDARLPNPQVVASFDRRTLAAQFAEIFDRSVASARRSPNAVEGCQ